MIMKTQIDIEKENDWICDCCGEKFKNEVDLLAHLFNSPCEKELKEKYRG